MKRDTLGAFLPETEIEIEGAPAGPLRGLTFGSKDIFDVAGTVTGCGNPDWAADHEPARSHAPAVQRLLDAGAKLAGKTITDELAFSLNGQNYHYGTPANVNAPGRIPGGSSCGSASAVAGGLVDLALGSDTGGSVRIPASYCGIYGLRPTHGRITLEGVMPLAPSLDTVGCFARSPELLAKAFSVLFDQLKETTGLSRLLMAEDAFELAMPGVVEALAPAVQRLEALIGPPERVQLGEPGGGLSYWAKQFRTILGGEAWQSHGAWIEARRPEFGPELGKRLEAVREIPDKDIAIARVEREEFAGRMRLLLGERGVICLPTAPGIAPRIDTPAAELEDYRFLVHSLTCTAGLARLPQISLPVGTLEGCPLGLSLIAGSGCDEDLLVLAQAFTHPALN